MDAQTQQRYQAGGDLYTKLLSQYGKATADRMASAVLTPDIGDDNETLAAAENGGARETGFWGLLGNQLATDPLGAPLEGLNRTAGNTILSFLKSPWVVVIVAVTVFSVMGGWQWLGRKVFKA